MEKQADFVVAMLSNISQHLIEIDATLTAIKWALLALVFIQAARLFRR